MLLETTRELGASIIRRRPRYFKRDSRRKFNNIMLNLGARPIVVAKMKDGTLMRLDLRTQTELDAYFTREFEPFWMHIVHSIYDFNSVLLDIGANIGFYTVAYANFIKKNNGSGHVVAFEVYRGNYERNLYNLRMNEVEDFCTLFNIGLSDRRREDVLTLREDFERGSNTGNAAIATNEQFDLAHTIRKVPCKLDALDNIWHKLQDRYESIDFVKMDIEGHEDFCLKGGAKTFSAYRPTILMEVSKDYYEARGSGIDMDCRFLPLIPKDYLIYKSTGNKLEQIESFNVCNRVQNVLLVPREKTELEAYKKVLIRRQHS